MDGGVVSNETVSQGGDTLACDNLKESQSATSKLPTTPKPPSRSPPIPTSYPSDLLV